MCHIGLIFDALNGTGQACERLNFPTSPFTTPNFFRIDYVCKVASAIKSRLGASMYLTQLKAIGLNYCYSSKHHCGAPLTAPMGKTQR